LAPNPLGMKKQMAVKQLGPEDMKRLFANLHVLVDEAEAAYLSGDHLLARHATANLSFATNLIHSSLKEQVPALS
jgi:hypothetical protein